jgi:septum formation inhibitor MinC
MPTICFDSLFKDDSFVSANSTVRAAIMATTYFMIAKKKTDFRNEKDIRKYCLLDYVTWKKNKGEILELYEKHMPIILGKKAKKYLWHEKVLKTKMEKRAALKQQAREASQAQTAPLVPQKAKQSTTFKRKEAEEQSIPSYNPITYTPPPIRSGAPRRPVVTGNSKRPVLKD